MSGMKWECLWGFLSELVFCYFGEVNQLMARLSKYQRQNSTGTYMIVAPERLNWCTPSCSVVQSCTLREDGNLRKKRLKCTPAPDSLFGYCRMTGVGRGLWRFSYPLALAQAELIAHVHVQMSFEYLQGWRLHRCSGQPMPFLLHALSKRCFLIFRGNFCV